jgi:hypothetical protein
MSSKKNTSSFFKMTMFILCISFFVFIFFIFKKDKKYLQVEKPVTTTSVVVEEAVVGRVTHNNSGVSDNQNGPVTIGLNLDGISFNLKNSK